MIYLRFNIRNPWSNRWSVIKLFSGKTIFPNKFWELQFNKSSDILSFEIDLTHRQDHSGLFLEVAFIGYEMIFDFYDRRHYNREKGCWETCNHKDTSL